MKPYPIHTVVSHGEPVHGDEMAGILFLQVLEPARAEVLFPGVSTAKIELWSRNDLKGMSAQEWLERGYLLLGIGGGEFDEHVDFNLPNWRENQKTCCDLVAAKLGVADSPVYYRFIREVHENDTQGGKPLHFFSDIVRAQNSGVSFVRTYMDFRVKIMRLLAEDELVHSQGKNEWNRAGRMEQFQGPAGEVQMAVIESDSNFAIPYLNSRFSGHNPQITVLWKSTGNVIVFCAKHKRKNGDSGKGVASRLNLVEVVANVRRQIMKKRCLSIGEKEIRLYGQLTGTEMFSFDPRFGAGAIFNGTRTEPGMEPIGNYMTLDEFLVAVRKGIQAIKLPERKKKTAFKKA